MKTAQEGDARGTNSGPCTRRRGGGSGYTGLYRVRLRLRGSAGYGAALYGSRPRHAPAPGPRVVATALGVALLVFIPASFLSVLVGLLIVVAALMSFLSANSEVNNKTRLVGGIASGVTSTTAAIGGAPLALIYQDRSGAELCSTLAISFVAGIVISLMGLALAGKVEGWHFILALKLLPGLLVGLWASRW